MFKTKFYSYQHVRSETTVNEVLRCEKYSIPLVLDKYVDSVFHTIQMPSPMRGGPVLTPIYDKNIPLFLKEGIHKEASQVTGFITPAVLKSFYNINGVGSSAATQSVYETLTQYYSPADLLKFQQTYKLSTASAVINIGAHNSDSQCITTPNNCIEGNYFSISV